MLLGIPANIERSLVSWEATTGEVLIATPCGMFLHAIPASWQRRTAAIAKEKLEHCLFRKRHGIVYTWTGSQAYPQQRMDQMLS